MEARVGSESQQLFVAGSSNMNAIGKRSFEWDLNDWRWDGELFVASPLNAAPAGCRNKQVCCAGANGLVSNSSSSSSECADFGLIDKGKGEAEKRRRIIVVEEDEPFSGVESLNLKLGGHHYPLVEADLATSERNNGKKGKSQGGNSSHPACQVEGCDADLSDSKDYHRRHKVCETHAKASSAVVKNAIQRFCQQCSRFHLLEEFDEGKRSCRRRLAGHNRRRRKTHPDANANGNSSIDERACGSLLMSLLRILSNSQSVNSKNRSQDGELIAHFLGNLANLANSFDPSSLSRLLQASQDPQKLVTIAGTSSEAVIPSVPNGVHGQESGSPLCSTAMTTCIAGTQSPIRQTDNVTSVTLTTVDMPTNRGVASPERIMDRTFMKDFDLNNTYSDPQDCEEVMEKPTTPVYARTGSPNCPSWLLQDSLQSSPPQTSGNSDSTSNQSQSNLHAIAQCRTDRIIFKLFGKDPNDLPLVLRAQILEWLSNSPTDIESYIRPGCIILTIYIRQAESAWVDLCHELDSNLGRLLYNSTCEFWTNGWIFARVRDHAAFICDGQIVLNIPLLIGDSKRCKILSVTPMAVCCSTKAKFTVKGINLAQTTRLLCSFDGQYLGQETTYTIEETERGAKQGLSQCLSFSCLLPDVTGRGFIEFEDSGLHNEFFPFIVAEEDVCSEIRVLENAIDIASHQLQEGTDIVIARSQALEFINELGWLLRRNHMRSVSGETEFSGNLFALARFRWLMSFAMSREWSAVVKKLLDILFNNMVDAGGQSTTELALSETLLHCAVQMKSRSMVESLLRYVPRKSLKDTNPEQFLFRPDMPGPSDITPLHIAASSNGAESILDALTDDPGLLGIKAWKNIRDRAGFTPEDYAVARGHDSYIALVQRKIDKQRKANTVVLNVSSDTSHKQAGAPKSGKPSIFELSKWLSTERQQSYCSRCSSRQLIYTNSAARTLLYRPVMLSLVGIAAVCVCVGIMFKTPPQVFFVSPSFRWELLESGFM